MRITWHASKAAANLIKHGVSFEEAATALADPLSATALDPDHSNGELRFLTLGVSSTGRSLIVAHADDGDTIRIISARLATTHERKAYEC